VYFIPLIRLENESVISLIALPRLIKNLKIVLLRNNLFWDCLWLFYSNWYSKKRKLTLL